MASEIHLCGVALTDIRRLGVEYARSVSPPPPADLLWWHRALLEVLGHRSAEVSTGLLLELRDLTGEVGTYLAGGRE